MIIFPSMLCSAADAAGIAYPANVDDDYDKDAYPHWHILCATQLSRSCQPGEHFENAKVIAKLEVEAMKTMTLEDFVKIGVYPE